QQAGDGEIDLFPRGWARQAALVWARLRRNIVRQAGPEACPTAPAGRPGWREHLLSRVREHGLALLRRSFERECGRRRYDVYHEPNFSPWEGEVPAVVTVHDLSVLLHPHWHPADRVRDFERRFRAGLSRCVHYLTISENGRQEAIGLLGL